jgi:hypothetical protein
MIGIYVHTWYVHKILKRTSSADYTLDTPFGLGWPASRLLPTYRGRSHVLVFVWYKTIQQNTNTVTSRLVSSEVYSVQD